MNTLMLAGIGGGVVLLWIIAGVAYFVFSRRPSSVEQRLGQFTGGLEEAAAPREERETKTKRTSSALSEQLSQAMAGQKFAEGMLRDLARADLKLNVAEYLAAHVLLALLGALLAWWFVGRGLSVPVQIIITLAGGLVSLFIPRVYVGFLQGQRLSTFDNQLGDMLNLVVNGLRAGYSVMQALESVGKELPPPISVEFKRVVQEMQLGIPMEQALSNLTRRIPSKDLDFVVTAINVQREVGGNLSEILDNISFTIRERVRIKGEVRVLTSQVRTSGTVLSMIPFFLTLILWFLNPEYLMSVTQGGPICTAAIICVVLGLISSSYFIMMRIADIEV